MTFDPQGHFPGSVAELGDGAGAVAAEHLGFAFRLAIPQSESVKTDGSTILVTTGEPHPFGNFATGLDPGDAEGLSPFIEALVATNAPAAFLYPGAAVAPAVAERLAASGFDHSGAMPAMVCDINKMPPTTLTKGYEFVEIEDPVSGLDWIECLAAGYPVPIGVAGLFVPRKSECMRYFSIRYRARTVSISALCLAGGVAGIYCVATLEGHRGKGLGAHITAEPLRRSQAEGYRVGVLQASELGYKIYERLGFKDLGQVQVYVRMPMQLQ